MRTSSEAAVQKSATPTDKFIFIAQDLETAGLFWHPEVGDEVTDRSLRNPVSILVDPQGLTPDELRSNFIWLPTVEQMIHQCEARQAVLFHAGFEITGKVCGYKTVIQAPAGHIESCAESFRISLGLALRGLLMNDATTTFN
jgi:hypothetical protein